MTRVFHPALSGPEQSRYQITDVASVSRSGLCINESPIRDRCGRTMGDLRLSVIDQCNLRCRYCMPEAEYAWLPRADLLSVDEISLIVDAFIAVGVDKIRLTGGEPLIRSDLAAIIEVISAKVGDGSGLQDLAITTNGVLLADQARKLKSAGMRRITISLDTLRPDRFKAISQRGTHYKVIEGIEAVAAAGFTDTKLDSVVIRGFNDDELSDLIEFARNVNAEVRFIEYMDVGGATNGRWTRSSRKRRCCQLSGRNTVPSRPCRSTIPRPRTATDCRTEQHSASLLRPPSHSVQPVTGRD
ncbi:molybdenum cofactor biosynthesis protein A 3 [Mycobacterium tuberculosis BTB12-400]|nr:molybdenum cofactor biosynthesis protein A 3 [Mycobacterium tuberculosis BTB12-400]